MALTLAESQQKAASVRPLEVATRAYLERIIQEESSVNHDAVAKVRLQALAQDAVESLASILAVSELQIPRLPSSDEPLNQIIEELKQLHAALAAQLHELDVQVQKEQARYDELTQVLISELG